MKKSIFFFDEIGFRITRTSGINAVNQINAFLEELEAYQLKPFSIDQVNEFLRCNEAILGNHIIESAESGIENLPPIVKRSVKQSVIDLTSLFQMRLRAVTAVDRIRINPVLFMALNEAGKVFLDDKKLKSYFTVYMTPEIESLQKTVDRLNSLLSELKIQAGELGYSDTFLFAPNGSFLAGTDDQISLEPMVVKSLIAS